MLELNWCVIVPQNLLVHEHRPHSWETFHQNLIRSTEKIIDTIERMGDNPNEGTQERHRDVKKKAISWSDFLSLSPCSFPVLCFLEKTHLIIVIHKYLYMLLGDLRNVNSNIALFVPNDDKQKSERRKHTKEPFWTFQLCKIAPSMWSADSQQFHYHPNQQYNQTTFLRSIEKWNVFRRCQLFKVERRNFEPLQRLDWAVTRNKQSSSHWPVLFIEYNIL